MNEFDGDMATASQRMDPHATRDHLRALIRREIASFHPTEDARQPLELIVESTLRYSDNDGILTLTVLDESGKVRLTGTGEAEAEMVVRDVLSEIRRTRPALFENEQDQTGDDASPVMVAEERPMRRDWLQLATDRPTESSSGDARISTRFDWQTINAWFQREAPRWKHSVLQRTEHLRTLPEHLRILRERMRRDLPGKDEISPESRRWARRPLAMGGVAAALLVALGVFAVLRNDGRSGDAGEISQTGSVASPVREETAALRGVPEVIDTATLSVQGRVVHLFGVEWASGGGKPEDLARYLSGREVTCSPVSGSNTHRCQVADKDLSKVVLYNGGGRATPQATDELKAAAEHARQARIGVWSR
ncbi:thermonuclease family protein [Microvirga rosea]|uniref:thermonuclease family protein n=1 Tax=Microvirga rosea TaxID=2715425 RepID=UPI001D0B7E1D|nr:hypothetical protein [Microvirga rosea]MCB8819525.1 hypothetical protein [Microvirga rosea]